MALAHKLVGNAMQMAVCQLAEGQTVYCEAGKFLWKTVNVSVETRLAKPQGNQQGAQATAGGLLQKALDVGKRVLAGESLAFQYYRANGGSGLVTFAGVLPGRDARPGAGRNDRLVRREGRVRGGRVHR